MSQSRRLKRVKARLPISFQSRSEETSQATGQSIGPESPSNVHRMLRVLLGHPWNDYDFVRQLGQIMLASNRCAYFELVNIQKYSTPNILEQSRILSSIYHPNISNIYGVYSDDGETFLITENLEISISQLQFETHEPAGWEIATIVTEVLKGVVYLSSRKLSCKDLSREDIRCSFNGEIKLSLDLQKLRHDRLHESPKVSQVLLDCPIIVDIIEEMMLSRLHLAPDDNKWFADAQDFLSCALSGSLESLMNHCFLELAVSPRRLAPRIRYAFATR